MRKCGAQNPITALDGALSCAYLDAVIDRRGVVTSLKEEHENSASHRQEPANAVLLPVGRLHHFFDTGPFGLAQQGEHALLGSPWRRWQQWYRRAAQTLLVVGSDTADFFFDKFVPAGLSLENLEAEKKNAIGTSPP